MILTDRGGTLPLNLCQELGPQVKGMILACSWELAVGWWEAVKRLLQVMGEELNEKSLRSVEILELVPGEWVQLACQARG